MNTFDLEVRSSVFFVMRAWMHDHITDEEEAEENRVPTASV